MKTRSMFCLLFVTIFLCICLIPVAAFAESGDDAGNVFSVEESVGGKTIGLDLYAVGKDVSVSNSEVASSALLAGYNVQVNSVAIGGSLRAAGYTLYVDNAQIAANATLAGYSIDIGDQVTARGIYTASSTMRFSGTCDTLTAFGQSVTILGTVNGSVHISADQVYIGDDAVINGTLYVSSTSEPNVASTAKIADMQFEQLHQKYATSAHSTVHPFISTLKKLAWMLSGRVLLAILFFFIIGGSLNRAGTMLSARPWAMPLSGLITLIAAPTAAIILLITVIGVPAGALLLCLYIIAIGFSVSFMGCVGGQLLFPKLHGLLASIIGVCICSIAVIIPYLGGMVRFVCMVYTLGYFVQTIYLQIPKKNSDHRPSSSATGDDFPI